SSTRRESNGVRVGPTLARPETAELVRATGDDGDPVAVSKLDRIWGELDVDCLHKYRVGCLQNESQGACSRGVATRHARSADPPHSSCRADAWSRDREAYPADI